MFIHFIGIYSGSQEGVNRTIGLLVLSLFQDNLREDGRGCEDYRHIELETEVVSNTSGSAKLRIVR